MTDYHDQSHFRKRQKQASAVVLSIFAIALVAGGIYFKKDLDQSRLEQQWGLWRDDNCTLTSPSTREPGNSGGSLYAAANHRGAPGSWSCTDGSSYELHNSDLPPKHWTPPAAQGAPSQ